MFLRTELPGQRAGRVEVFLRKRLRCGWRTDRLIPIFASQLDVDLLAGAKVLLLAVGHDATRSFKKADFHLAVLYSRDAGVSRQGQVRPVDRKPDTAAVRNVDHDPIFRHLIADNLAKFAGEEK